MDIKNGLFLVDKKEGVTSRSVDNLIKKKFNIKKVGHLGTLDPFASGLLIVMVNEATKLAPFFHEGYKEYIGTIKLFVATDTLDKDGNITKTEEFKKLDISEINGVLRSFLGKSMQKPPIFSALKVNGRPAYKYAREGKEIDLKKREIEVKKIELISYENDLITFSAIVSGGTYMRVLASDIANKLSTIGHLISLRRMNVSGISVDNAKDIDELTFEDLINLPDSIRLLNIPIVEIEEKDINFVKNGHCIFLKNDYPIVCLSYKERILAIYEKEGNKYISKRGINDEGH